MGSRMMIVLFSNQTWDFLLCLLPCEVLWVECESLSYSWSAVEWDVHCFVKWPKNAKSVRSLDDLEQLINSHNCHFRVIFVNSPDYSQTALTPSLEIYPKVQGPFNHRKWRKWCYNSLGHVCIPIGRKRRSCWLNSFIEALGINRVWFRH